MHNEIVHNKVSGSVLCFYNVNCRLYSCVVIAFSLKTMPGSKTNPVNSNTKVSENSTDISVDCTDKQQLFAVGWIQWCTSEFIYFIINMWLTLFHFMNVVKLYSKVFLHSPTIIFVCLLVFA